MTTIEIDFDVFKALTVRRANESISYNDVLRELLNLPAHDSSDGDSQVLADGTFKAKEVSLPPGTELRAVYKGKPYVAKVVGGAINIFDTDFSSPSAAACFITKTQVNGWNFWEVKRPGDSHWRKLNALRTKE